MTSNSKFDGQQNVSKRLPMGLQDSGGVYPPPPHPLDILKSEVSNDAFYGIFQPQNDHF